MEVVFQEEGLFFHYWCWLFTLALWALVALAVVEFLRTKKDDPGLAYIYIIVAVFVYIVVLINSFCSPAFSFLGSQISIQEVERHMQEIYKSPPTIMMKMECYHYETRHYTRKEANGTEVHYTESVKVVTRTAADAVRIMSYHDVSLPLFIDLSDAEPSMLFLKIKLNSNIAFANDGSAQDYQRQVAQFKYQNNWDAHYEYSETKKIQGFREYFMIPIRETRSSYVGQGWYALSAFFSFAELYKNYLSGASKYFEYTVSKEASTLNTNLFQPNATHSFTIVTPDYDPRYNRGF